MKININKTKVMIFNKSGRLITRNLNINNHSIECASGLNGRSLSFSKSQSLNVSNKLRLLLLILYADNVPQFSHPYSKIGLIPNVPEKNILILVEEKQNNLIQSFCHII
jgi:hypothetical protein